MTGFTCTYRSHTYGKGGQHTNGPDHGVFRCEHEISGTVVEIDTRMARGQHNARYLALTLCQIAVEEMAR